MVYFKLDALCLGEVSLVEEQTAQVAVKVLKEGVSRETREDFTREVQIMAGFDHENILRLIGIVSVGELCSHVLITVLKLHS